MEDLINDSIIESISEEYQIYKMTVDYDLVNDSSIVRYVIRDENEELVRHNNMTFFSSLKDADKALAEIVYKRFEEVSQWFMEVDLI